MSLKTRKWISGIVATVCTVLYAALFATPHVMDEGGVVEGSGMGRAIEVLFVGAVIYGLSLFALTRVLGASKGEG
ncbi:MAG: hypothetical protein AAFU41_17120 [Pseudomonadota bacterium]